MRGPGPLASKELRDAAKELVKENAPAHRPTGHVRGPNGVQEFAPTDKRSPQSRGRRQHATMRVQAAGDLEQQLEDLRAKFDVPASPQLDALILDHAQDYADEHEDAVLLGFAAMCEQDFGMYAFADEVAQDAGYDGNTAISALRDAGLGDEDVDAACDLAADFPDDDVDASAAGPLVAAAFLAEESGHPDLVGRLAEHAGVDVDDLVRAVDEAVEQRILDPDQLENDPSDAGEPAAEDLGEVDHEADELATRYGLPDSDMQALRDLAEQQGWTLEEALHAIADHQGLDLDQLEQQAGAGTSEHEPAGDGGCSDSSTGYAAAGEPAAAASGE